MKKRIISFLLVMALVLTMAPMVTIEAEAANLYTINGVNVSYTDYTSTSTGCWAYANSFYKKIWGYNFSNSFSDSDNSLRNLSDSDLILTEEHLKAYVTNAPIGSVLRICNSEYLHGTDGWGHSQLIVSKDSNGFTVFEGGVGSIENGYRREKYYTWSGYCSWWSDYQYIKYIKWPGAAPFDPEPQPIDTRYPTPFYAYVLSIDTKVQCYDSINGAALSSNYVYVDDECVIQEVYTNGWCKFLCPWPGYDNMATKYAPISIFLQSGLDWFVKAAFNTERTVYKKTNLQELMGSRTVSGGVKIQPYWDVFKVGQSGDYSQFIYTTDKGNYCGWLDHTAGPSKDTTLSVVPGTSETATIFSWTTSSAFKSVSVRIYKDTLWTGTDYSIWDVESYSASKVLPAGTYYAYVDEIDEHDDTCFNTTSANYITFTVSAHTHSYGSWYTQSAATCSSKGVERRDCETCDHYETREIAAKGHSYGSWYVTQAPTCEVKGVERRNCNNCSYYETRQVDTKDHHFDVTIYEPLCGEQGYTEYVCDYCGYTYTDNYTDALEHEYEATIYGPSCEEPGYIEYYCELCGDWYEEEYTDAVGHAYDVTIYEPTCEDAGYIDYYCDLCGDWYEEEYADALGHAYYLYAEYEPTCEDDGYSEYVCARCDDCYEDDFVDALGHAYNPTVYAPTCQEEGYTEYECARCGDWYDDHYVDPVGCSPIWVTENRVEATCTEAGSYDNVAYCKWCDEELSRESIQLPALDHVPGAVVEENYISGTCVEEGSYDAVVYCEVCGEELSRETILIPGPGPSYEAIITEPTCTEEGYTTYTCIYCGDSYVTDYVDALGHDYESVVTEPTYTEQGYMTHTCSRCGDSYVDSYTDPLDPETSVHVEVGNVTGKAGETVEVVLTLENAPALRALGIMGITYDTGALTLISAEWLVEGALLTDWNANDLIGAAAWLQNTDLNGEIFKLTFQINEDAVPGDYAIGCTVTAKEKSGAVETVVPVATMDGCVSVIEYVIGDTNGDDMIDTDDAIYLLYHTLFGEDMYEVVQNCDFNGDGMVDTDDAIYLLYHTLFGESMYPLN